LRLLDLKFLLKQLKDFAMTERLLDWESAIGQPIRIYRNLNTKKMSVQIKRPGIGWRVAGYTLNAIVADVSFTVSEASRQRAIREHCRNVHAFGQGQLVAQVDESIVAPVALGYNPFVHGFFYDKNTEQPIERCRYLVVRENQVFVSQDAPIASALAPATSMRLAKPQFFSASAFSALWLPAAA
jgi:hypothetical protein